MWLSLFKWKAFIREPNEKNSAMNFLDKCAVQNRRTSVLNGFSAFPQCEEYRTVSYGRMTFEKNLKFLPRKIRIMKKTDNPKLEVKVHLTTFIK